MLNLENYNISVAYKSYGDHGHSDDHQKHGFKTLEEAETYLKEHRDTPWTGNWAIRLAPKSIEELEKALAPKPLAAT